MSDLVIRARRRDNSFAISWVDPLQCTVPTCEQKALIWQDDPGIALTDGCTAPLNLTGFDLHTMMHTSSV
ncbi:MAG: hypothetical protein CFE33_03100 [Pseudorhodobacter sp. PARRP1]|nr:MAG: hypothetical protein CFE33_03100 [Pseudorhodobacter sp. PARRP1]